ncbi:unnamed protein product [Chrysodeixis includens]|uniref:BEN domain-containing protein n=1 Tax=Chrysodeixis includens TaxID=689277 RepID=A0A9P0BSM0_CHRIL|nr:unnamed protein product [Chrysodeixis includens]
MASRVWLLVEWVDETGVNMCPAYDVVNVDTMAYDETDLHPGNVIFIRVKHENPRRAKIVRISESKRYVKEQKEILERENQQVKNVLQICMRTIQKLKSDNSFNSSLQTSNHHSLPHVVVANTENSGSDSDSEPFPQVERNRPRNFSKSKSRHSHHNRNESIGGPSRSSNKVRRSIVSSTPIPPTVQAPATLVFDQGTQTEDILLKPPIEKIEAMEAQLQNLYSQFQSLVTQVPALANASMLDPDHTIDESNAYLGPNSEHSWVERNNSDYREPVNVESIVEEFGTDEGEEIADNETVNSSTMKVEEKNNPNTLRVRRMSAQTTNNVEALTSNDADMVPIGSGNVKVPARLLNEIDWNSHTSATRQLLQAVFPRRVLATHSLTGKQSPAFLNRPPKKILDPKLVEDIVKTVSTRCVVPKNLVRNCITIKCTDEAKLYRNRQQYKQARQALVQNEENIPPSTPSSDEANAVVN